VLRREVITLGTINDGIEADFPGSDVPRYRGLVKALFVQETDRDVAAQMPDYWVYQDGMFAICLDREISVKSHWTVPMGGKFLLLIAVGKYRGADVAFFSTKRPAASRSELWPAFNSNMADVIRPLRNANLAVMGGIDLNSSSALSISDETKLSWYPPYRSSIVGLLASGSVFIDGVNQMPATGEHAPVVALGRVPVRA
jgi:hypothetical protein